MTKLILYLVAGAIIELAVIEGIVWSVDASHHAMPDNLTVAILGVIVYGTWSIIVTFAHFSRRRECANCGRGTWRYLPGATLADGRVYCRNCMPF